MSQLREFNPERGAEIDKMIHASGRAEAELGYVPLRAKHRHLAVVVEKNNGHIIKILTMNPWPDSWQPAPQQ
jgi:hypothetical protein